MYNIYEGFYIGFVAQTWWVPVPGVNRRSVGLWAAAEPPLAQCGDGAAAGRGAIRMNAMTIFQNVNSLAA